jgi:hypothetical protein
VNIRSQLEFLIALRGWSSILIDPQMSWIKSHSKIRTTAFFVSRIDSGIQTMLKLRADPCNKMAAC